MKTLLTAISILVAAGALAGSSIPPPDGMPKEQESNFKTFAGKCSQCHDPSRAYNGKYGDEKSITGLVSRMSRKPGAGITKDDQKKIVAYLTWRAASMKK